MLCVYFIHKWRDLQFKVDSERQIFGETFHGSINLLSEFLPEICWEEIAVEILFVFRFWCLAWDSNPGFSSNKPTHYLLDHGDFSSLQNLYIGIMTFPILNKCFLLLFALASCQKAVTASVLSLCLPHYHYSTEAFDSIGGVELPSLQSYLLDFVVI